ncbi:MAG: hypothetical protein ACM3IJ_04870 [Candidatus Levyibacteriota bacterium]
MPEPPKDQPPRRNVPKAEGSHRADGSTKDKAWQERAHKSWEQGNIESREILKRMLTQYGLPVPGDQELDEIIPQLTRGPVRPAKYDAYNQVDIGDNGTEEEPREERVAEGVEQAEENVPSRTRENVFQPIRDQALIGTIQNPAIKETINMFNRQVEQGNLSSADDDGVGRVDKVIDKLVELYSGGQVSASDQEAIKLIIPRLEQQSKEARERMFAQKIQSERAQIRGGEYLDLTQEINEYRARFENDIRLEEQGAPREAHSPEFLKRRFELVEKLRKMIKDAPSIETNEFPYQLIRAALWFRETREQLINDIIFKSFQDQTEQGHYEINLYASGNLDALLGGLSLRGLDEEYQYFRRLRTSAQNFYEMNRTIGAGNIENFIRIAEGINWTQFETMQQVRGVPLVMRLYEQKYQEILGKEKTISSEAYVRLKEEVEKSFRNFNDSGLIKSEYSSIRGEGSEHVRLQAWEIERALNAGRAFFNITFRAAEQISLGQVPGLGGDKAYKQFASYPQESASRIMNPVIWTISRFLVAEGKGGDILNGYVKQEYQAYLNSKKRNLGINRLKEIGGMSIEDLQVSGMMGISGFLSGWRLENLAFAGLRFGKGEHDNLRDWLDEKITYRGKEQSKAQVIADLKGDKGVAKGMGLGQRQKELKKIFEDLIDGHGMEMGLGVILRNIAEREEVGYELRKYIWDKVAERNLPLMVSYLTNITPKDGKGQGLENISIDALRRNNGFQDEQKWQAFLMKLEQQREIQTKRHIAGRDKDGKLVFEDIQDIELDSTEQAMKSAIVSAGKAIAGDLADVYFGYVPFLNDVPIEEFQFSGPGEEAYRRRTAGDFGSFYKAAGAYGGIIGNPGAMKEDDVLGKLNEIEQGIESPNGVGSGQDATYPVFSAYLKFIMTHEGQRWSVLKDVKKKAMKPTSDAQEWYGIEAPSLNEGAAFHLVEKARHLGFISHSQEALLLKRRRIGFLQRLWETIRDYGPLAAVATLAGIPTRAVSGK